MSLLHQKTTKIDFLVLPVFNHSFNAFIEDSLNTTMKDIVGTL